MARRYLISKMENTTNLKNAAVAKALNSDSATPPKKTQTHHMSISNRKLKNVSMEDK